jgi:hypothetical protein
MNNQTNLKTLAKEAHIAFEVWCAHPNNSAYKLKYELAKEQLDNEIKNLKKSVTLKEPHH